jgi:hypothetical protein
MAKMNANRFGLKVATLAGKGTGRKSHFDIFTRGAWERGLEREGGGNSFVCRFCFPLHTLRPSSSKDRPGQLSIRSIIQRGRRKRTIRQRQHHFVMTFVFVLETKPPLTSSFPNSLLACMPACMPSHGCVRGCI